MFFFVKFMFIYVKIKKLLLFINIPIEKILAEILVLFSDEEIRKDIQIPRGNPRVRELILEKFENPGGFPHVFLVRK